MSREDLMQLDTDILERFQAEVDPYSTGSSSSHPGGFGEGTSRPIPVAWTVSWTMMLSHLYFLFIESFYVFLSHLEHF